MVQFSHPYVTTGKTTALTRWIFVGKVTSLLFKTLSRFVIAFLPRSNTAWYLLYVESEKSQFHRSCRVVVATGWGWRDKGKWEDVGQGYKISVIAE